jgi:hypothetical protein
MADRRFEAIHGNYGDFFLANLDAIEIECDVRGSTDVGSAFPRSQIRFTPLAFRAKALFIGYSLADHGSACAAVQRELQGPGTVDSHRQPNVITVGCKWDDVRSIRGDSIAGKSDGDEQHR